MKMAKASQADLDAAMEICHAMESLHRGHLPDAMTDGDDVVWYDEAKHAGQVVDHLVKLVGSASLFRVIFGMMVLLDPRNEIVDQGADALALHPKYQLAHNLLLLSLYHHQGGSSPVGQPIRKLLGIGEYEHLTAEQIATAKATAVALWPHYKDGGAA